MNHCNYKNNVRNQKIWWNMMQYYTAKQSLFAMLASTTFWERKSGLFRGTHTHTVLAVVNWSLGSQRVLSKPFQSFSLDYADIMTWFPTITPLQTVRTRRCAAVCLWTTAIKLYWDTNWERGTSFVYISVTQKSLHISTLHSWRQQWWYSIQNFHSHLQIGNVGGIL